MVMVGVLQLLLVVLLCALLALVLHLEQLGQDGSGRLQQRDAPVLQLLHPRDALTQHACMHNPLADRAWVHALVRVLQPLQRKQQIPHADVDHDNLVPQCLRRLPTNSNVVQPVERRRCPTMERVSTCQHKYRLKLHTVQCNVLNIFVLENICILSVGNSNSVSKPTLYDQQ